MSHVACPTCGARNPASAPWCTQCYAALGAPSRTPAPEAPAPEAPPDDPAGPTSGAADRGVRQRDDGAVEWRCGVCDGWSPLEASACVVCGSARRGFGDDPAHPPRPDRPLLVRSLLLPGLGHLAVGRTGSGLARAVFGLGWLLGGLVLAGAAARAGAGPWAPVPLLLGAAAVWVLTALDTRGLERGETRERLDPRTLLWLMVAVTLALVVVLGIDAWRLAA